MIGDMHDLEQEEDRIRREATELPERQRVEFYRLCTRRIRDPDTYAVLNWFFLVGLHHFYLGRWLRGLLNILAVLLSLPLLLSEWWVLGLGILLIVAGSELVELFRSQRIVRHYNNAVMRSLLMEVRDSIPG